MNKSCVALGISLVLLLPFLPGHTFSQQEKQSRQKPPAGGPAEPVFKVPVDVVVVSATVVDDHGAPVPGLTADDFKVYEDGKQQPIHTFALESYKTTQQVTPRGDQAKAAQAKPEDASEPSQARIFSIVIDDLTTASSYYPLITEAVRKFVDEDLLPGDQVAICSGSGRVVHPLTTDKQLLRSQLGDLYRKLDVSKASRSDCPRLTDLQAQRIASGMGDLESLNTAVTETYACMNLDPQTPRSQVESMVRSAALSQFSEAEYRNRGLLRNLRSYVRSLRHFEARKNLVLFSDGFLFQELTYELQDVVDQALRAGVIVNAVDARGLYVDMFDASEDTRFPLELIRWKQRLRSEDALLQGDSMNMLASDTGGLVHQNSNDLRDGLRKISERQAHFYVLTYAAPSRKADGRYHKIKLEVSRPGLQLSYRKGYYAAKEQLTFERRKKEDILEAMRAPGNVNEIPIRTGYVYYQVDEVLYEVELTTQVDIRRMPFVEEDARQTNLISLAVVALDDYDRYVDGIQKDVTFNLTPASYSELLNRGFASKVVFRVPRGRYKIKTVVRESAHNKVGSFTRGIEIP